MLKQITVYATLVNLAMAGSSLAQYVEKPSGVPMPPVIASAEEHLDKVTGLIYPTSPAEIRSRSIGSTEVLLAEIVTWLASNFNLPALHDHPRIEFVSTAKLVTMRYKGFLSQSSRENSPDEPAAQAAQHREVVAVYNDTTKTIFLAETWTGTTLAELSVLVHEMVHHLQNLGKLKYECSAAREKPAYLAQNQWLKQFGRDLENEFEIDMFTVVATSACIG